MGTGTRVEVRARAVGNRAWVFGMLTTIALCDANLGALASLRAEPSPPRSLERPARFEPPTRVGADKAVGSGVASDGPLVGTCSADAECDDGLACTNDLCNPITGQCENATNLRETVCRPGYLETAPGFQCASTCSGDGTEPCVPGVAPNILGRLGFACPKRYTFHNVLEVSKEVRLTTWAMGDFSALDQHYSIHLVGTTFTFAEIYKVGQLDCTAAAPHVSFTISAADWNLAIQDPGSGVGDVIFEITATAAVSCGDCAFEGGVHLEFELQACDDGVACTEDLCVPVLGCINAPDNAACDDGLFCNGAETCDAALDCVLDPESVPNCDDGLGCTNDICNDVIDSCENALFVRETICRPGYLETEPMFGCGSECSGDGTEPCAVGGDPSILGRLGINCPKRYTFFDVLPVGNDVQLTTWAKGNYSGLDRFYGIHLAGTSFTEQAIYLLTGQDDCSAAPLPVNFTIPAAEFNAAINDAGSGFGDIIFEITASTAVSCSDCAFNGGVHLEFELQPSCEDGLFCNGAETCDDQGNCQPGMDPCTNPLLPFCDDAMDLCVECLAISDVTGDEVVDWIDVRSLPACMTGPVGPVAPAAYPPECRCFDTEQNGAGDGDVDLADVQAFQQRFGGA